LPASCHPYVDLECVYKLIGASSGEKRRPALMVSRDDERRPGFVVCFITSVPRCEPDVALRSQRPP
jgi:hypothetical protein